MKPVAFGKYTLLRRLARGGMAELFLARSGGVAGVQRLVVIKLVASCHARNESLISMFADEARIAAMLDHPNIGQVLDVGEVSGQYYLAMEYLHGKNLQEIIEAVQARGPGGVPTNIALYITTQLCSALHFAHQRSGLDGRPLDIIHRDVSPSNIMVTYHGNVKLLDFGIARAANRSSLTRPGRIKGKVRYLSPEQAWGKDLDQRTDIFSLGICLWESTVGRYLFDAEEQAQVLEAVTSGVIPLPSQIVSGYPPQLEAIVMKALAFEPKDRYASAREMHVDLEYFARNQRFQLSELDTARFMGETFSEEVAVWQAAQQRGTSLLDHLLEKLPDSTEADADVLDTADDLKTLPPRSTPPYPGPAAAAGDGTRRTTFFSGSTDDPGPTKADPPSPTRKTVLFGESLPSFGVSPSTRPGPPMAGKEAAATPLAVQTDVDPARMRASTPLKVSTQRRVAITPDGNAKVESYPANRTATPQDMQPTLVTATDVQQPPAADAPSPSDRQRRGQRPSEKAATRPTIADIDQPAAEQSHDDQPADTMEPDAIPSRRRRPRTGDWAHQASTLEQRPGTHPFFRRPEVPPTQAHPKGGATIHSRFTARTIVIAVVILVGLGALLIRARCAQAPETEATTAQTTVSESTVRITSDPSGATVFSGLTGQELGRTPLAIDATHVEGQRLEIHLPGYETTSLIVVRDKPDITPPSDGSSSPSQTFLMIDDSSPSAPTRC